MKFGNFTLKKKFSIVRIKIDNYLFINKLKMFLDLNLAHSQVDKATVFETVIVGSKPSGPKAACF